MNAPSTSQHFKENRAEINKANAQHSTGPKTKAGKAKASLNAVRTALTGRTVLLPTDDADAYYQHVKAHVAQFRPVGIIESALVQSLADHAWRLNRLVMIEMSIYAVGHFKFSSESDTCGAYFQYQTHLAHEKQLRNLHIQEARLRRYRAKDTAELKELQQARLAQEQARAEEDGAREEAAVALYLAAQSEGKPFDPAAHGFEFSIAQIQTFAAARQPANSSPRPKPSHHQRSKKLAA